MSMLIARQPIFEKNGVAYGYELFYRDTEVNSYSGGDGDMATSSVIAGKFLSQGVDSWMENRKVFINFTRNLISMDVATLFPHEYLVVEILETRDSCLEVMMACKRMKSLGYTIALGDFVFQPEYHALMELADIIKVNFLTRSEEEKKSLIRPYLKTKIRFLAEKVETQEEFKKALLYGYTYFQGFYFSKPELLKLNGALSGKTSMLRLINALNQPEPNFIELTEIIEMDTGFAYEMLRLANTAYFSRGRRITSIKQALVRLGMVELKKWCYITGLRKQREEKHREVIHYSMTRAKFLEMLSADIGLQSKSSEFMTVGILSMLDVLIDCPMEEVLQELALSDEVKNILLNTDKLSPLAMSFQLIKGCEAGNWGEVSACGAQLGVPIQKVARIHHEAIKWVMAFEKELEE